MSVELCFLLTPHRDLRRCPSLFTPTGHCCISPVVPSLNCSSLGFSLSAVSGLLLSKVAPLCFWFHLLGFFFFFSPFSKTPSRHSHTCTDPTPPRSATETETIQERCVSLQPSISPLLFHSPHTFSCCSSMSVLTD